MTRVDFYILADAEEDAALRFACALSLRALAKGTPVHIHTRNSGQGSELDTLMWDYPKHRFVPHQLNSATPESIAPVHIDCDEPRLNEGLLINLGEDVPQFFGRFDRVAEIVVGATREQGRERYKHYRGRGYPLHHHELSDWEQAS